jgi:hypothetical protein
MLKQNFDENCSNNNTVKFRMEGGGGRKPCRDRERKKKQASRVQ